MTQQIKLIYVDDKPDVLLTEYLQIFKEENETIDYKEIEFDSNSRDFESLLTDNIVLESDIIIIDSKLFENESADSGSKFTGQEFKLLQKLSNPFIKVVVITQNTNLSEYDVLNKFATSRGNESQESANEFYDKNLKPVIEKCVKEILEFRRIGEVLEHNKDAYRGSVIVQKAQNLLEKIPTYRELTNEKVDELIKLINDEFLE